MIQNQFKILDLSFYFIFVKWNVVYKNIEMHATFRENN